MITLPGTLSTPTAGPILCPGAPILRDKQHGIVPYLFPCHDGDLGCFVTWLYPDNHPQNRVTAQQVRASALSLDLTADLGPTIALRWLGRHYGIDVGIGCPGWYQNEYGEWILGDDDDAWILGNIDSDEIQCRCVPGISAITNPLEALVAACLYAAGVPRE